MRESGSKGGVISMLWVADLYGVVFVCLVSLGGSGFVVKGPHLKAFALYLPQLLLLVSHVNTVPE